MPETPRTQKTRSTKDGAEQVVSPWAARVLEGRRRSGMTQAELADAAGVSTGTVQNIEAGKVKPQKAKLDAVKAVLGLDRDRSQAWSDDEWKIAEIVVALYSRLPEGEKDAAYGKVTALFAEMLTGGTPPVAATARQVGTHAGTTDTAVEYPHREHGSSRADGRRGRGTRG